MSCHKFSLHRPSLQKGFLDCWVLLHVCVAKLRCIQCHKLNKSREIGCLRFQESVSMMSIDRLEHLPKSTAISLQKWYDESGIEHFEKVTRHHI